MVYGVARAAEHWYVMRQGYEAGMLFQTGGHQRGPGLVSFGRGRVLVEVPKPSLLSDFLDVE